MLVDEPATKGCAATPAKLGDTAQNAATEQQSEFCAFTSHDASTMLIPAVVWAQTTTLVVIHMTAAYLRWHADQLLAVEFMQLPCHTVHARLQLRLACRGCSTWLFLPWVHNPAEMHIQCKGHYNPTCTDIQHAPQDCQFVGSAALTINMLFCNG